MTTKRVKQVGAALRSREAMENCVRGICDLKISESNLIDQMDDKLAEIRANYAPELAKIQTELTGLMALAQDWAENNEGEFNGKKSIRMTHGVVGFRTGMPMLKTLKGWTWDKVKEVLVDCGRYVRTKTEVAKDEIIAGATGEPRTISDSMLHNMGCKIVQDESFYVEPELTEKPVARETVAA